MTQAPENSQLTADRPMFGFFGGDRAKKAQQREEALEALVLAQGENSRSSDEAKKAIAYCQLCIFEYERWSKQSQTRWELLQGVVVIGGVVATLAGAISIPQAWDSLAWIRSLPAATVTIAAGFLSSFSYRENAVRYELAAVALWNELARYETRAAPYNKDEAEDTSAFLNTVCRLVEAELHNWSVLVREGRVDENGPKAPLRSRSGGARASQRTPPPPTPGSPPPQ